MKNERTCIACRAKKDKSELLRITRNKDGEMQLDLMQKAEGRGAYICNNKDCLKKVIKTKALNRSYKMNVQSDIYEKIGEKIGD